MVDEVSDERIEKLEAVTALVLFAVPIINGWWWLPLDWLWRR